MATEIIEKLRRVLSGKVLLATALLVFAIVVAHGISNDNQSTPSSPMTSHPATASGTRTAATSQSSSGIPSGNVLASTQAAHPLAASTSQPNRTTNTQPDASRQAVTLKRLTPLEPRAEPYALMANTGTVKVRFSVGTTGDAAAQGAIALRQSGEQGGIAMNDNGTAGDVFAADRIYGITLPIDTNAVKPDTCLSYEAMLNDGQGEIVSSPLRLCVSTLPVRVANSNTENPVEFEDGGKVVADEVLVTAKPGVTASDMRAVADSINATVVGSIPPLSLFQLKLPAAATAAQLQALVEQLNARPEIKAASVNAIGSYASTPNDPEYVNQHGLQRVRAQDVWDSGATGNGVIVAVLDSGLDRTHPDFGTVGNCQLAENDCSGVNTDALGHGTQVAGVIGAKTNNSLGIAGVAHGTKIHSIQVSADAAVTDVEMAQAFTDAAAYGLASVINASFGVLNAFGNWTPVCAAITSAVLNNGVPVAIVVNGVGNNNTNGAFYPSRCNDLNAALTRRDLFITVANSASVVDTGCGSVALDQRCSDSNYGAWVDMAAPGSAIRTTTLGNTYASPSGTSFSSPMVAGAAAILKSCGVPLNEIESTLRTSANVTVPFPDSSSAPRLDIYRALMQRNRAPTALALSNNSLNDLTDTSAGTVVGALSYTDADTCDKHTYSIVGGADAASFSIGGTSNDKLILTAGVLHYATKSSYAVTVRVTDYFGATFNQALTVNVVAAPAVNHTPTITSQSFTLNEHSTNGTSVGTVVASDTDAGNTLTYAITAGNTGNAFGIDANTGTLSVNNSTAVVSAFSLTVQVTDNYGASASATVTVNVNNAPTLSGQTFSINEGSSNGTPLGSVVASDPNGGTLSYSILSGNGNNNAFVLDAATGNLSVNNSAALVFATTPVFSLNVRVVDGGGLTANATVTVNLNAVDTPTPPVAPPASGGAGGGGCAVMPAGADPDVSLILAVLVLLGYGVRRRG